MTTVAFNGTYSNIYKGIHSNTACGGTSKLESRICNTGNLISKSYNTSSINDFNNYPWNATTTGDIISTGTDTTVGDTGTWSDYTAYDMNPHVVVWDGKNPCINGIYYIPAPILLGAGLIDPVKRIPRY